MPERRSCSTLRLDRSNASKPVIGKAAQPLGHTPAAAGPATAACPSACGSASCSWPVPPMLKLQRPSPLRKIGREGTSFARAKKPFAACCAQPGSAHLSKRRCSYPPPAPPGAALARVRCSCSTGSLHRWLEDRGPQLVLCWASWTTPRAKFWSPNSSPTEDARGYFRLLHRLVRRVGVPLSFYGDRHSVFGRNDDHWSVEEQLGQAVVNPPSSVAPCINSASPTSRPTVPKPRVASNASWGTFQDRLTSELAYLAGAHDLGTSNQVLRHFLPDHNPSLWSRPAPGGKSLASRSRKCGPHLLFSPPTQCRQRQRRPMERAPFPDPTPAATLQLRWGQGATGGISPEGNVSIYYADTKLHLNGG